MSDLDQQLLTKMGLTPATAADLMKMTRQAIHKGITSPKHYFTPTHLKELSDAVEEKLPDKVGALQNAIADMFEALTERFGGGGHARGVATAIGEAERLWLIFPRFSASFHEQPDAYATIFDAIAERTPEMRLRAPASRKLEITVYCDRNRIELERRFDEAWFKQRRILTIECDILEKMLPMIVVDPHKNDGNLCFGLVEKGFIALARGEAAARISSFGSHVSEKINDALDDTGRRPVDAQHDDLATLAKTGVRKI
jgi:hypothetical protein